MTTNPIPAFNYYKKYSSNFIITSISTTIKRFNIQLHRKVFVTHIIITTHKNSEVI